MQRDHLLQKNRLRTRNVFDGLTRHRLGQETDKIAGMPSLQRNSDFAVRLEAADARAMAGARVYHDKWAAQRIDLHTTRRDDAHQRIIDRPLERAAIHDQLGPIVENVRNRLGKMFEVLVAALAHYIGEQHAALNGIDHVFKGRREEIGQCNTRYG